MAKKRVFVSFDFDNDKLLSKSPTAAKDGAKGRSDHQIEDWLPDLDSNHHPRMQGPRSCHQIRFRPGDLFYSFASRINCSACFSASGVTRSPDSMRPISCFRASGASSSISAIVRPFTSRFSTR